MFHMECLAISKMKTLKLVHPKDNDFFEACREKLGWSLNISKINLKVSRNLYIPLILIAVAISIFSNFGMNYDVIEVLTFTKGYSTFNYTHIEESEWWRLISPIFMHFSIAHLAFNCLWIYVWVKKLK